MITVRPLRADERRLYLEIVNSAIQGLACTHYAPDVIAHWTVPINDETLRDLTLNTDGEIRLVAELAGTPAGIGALVVERSELRLATVVSLPPDEAAVQRWCERSNGWSASVA